MKLYCVTEGSYPFEVWSNSMLAECFDGDYDTRTDRQLPDPDYDTIALHPEILEKLPKHFIEEWSWPMCFFLTEEAAVEAFLRKRNKIAREYAKDQDKFKDLDWKSFSDRFRVMGVDVPETRSVRLEKVPERKCCANCAFDYYTEDDGHNFHSCAVCAKARGSANTVCAFWVHQDAYCRDKKKGSGK